MRRIIGIDLGTTYSCIAVFNERKGIFEVLPNKNGAQTTPSVVAVNAKGEVIVGEAAKRQLAAAKPGTVVAEIKRHMGELLDNKPYAVELGGRSQTPEEISAYILRDLKESAERALGEPVSAAVITVPAYFEEPQRQATIRAGQLAGLDVKRIINEPTAAAIAYGHDKHDEDEDDDDAGSRPVRILIYDLGGGTFDVSLIEIERGNIRVRATHGNHYLGGVDFDHMLATWMCGQIKARYGVDIEQLATSPDREGQRARQALNRIRADAEGYKHELSSQETVTVSFAMLTVPDPRTGDMLENVELELARATFEAMIAPRVEETLASVDHALRDAKLDRKDVDDVVLVGGSTRIPMIKRVLTKHFGKEPRTNIHPDLCVALGAAHEAIKYVDLDHVPETETREVIEKKVGTIAALVDVTGHSLGVGVTGGVMSVLIPRQTPMPTMRTELYQTSEDNQTEVRIEVFQGESRQVRENTLLREFTLGGLPPRPMGQVKIEITFALDSNQVLTVTARDKATGQEREIEIRDLRVQPVDASKLLPSPQQPADVAPKTRSVNPFGDTTPRPLERPEPTALRRPKGDDSTLRPIPERFKKYYDQAELLAGKAPAPDAQELNHSMGTLMRAAQTGDQAAIQMAGDALVQCLFDVRARQPDA